MISFHAACDINSDSKLAAFPGAEGFGKFTSGGRGGRVIEVTNLNDSGAGSFRDAVEQDGLRTVIFRVSGNIELESELKIKKGNLTIAGQTAPGDGICIKNYQTTVNADNVIIRFLRFRLGDEKKQEADALSVMNCKNVIIDHCSVSWGIDEVFSFYDNENSTMQWCIISEALNNSYHHKGEHGYGGIWGGKNASFHHNLLAHNSSRNPRFNGSRTKYSSDEESVDFRNNVIYNWGINSSYGGEGGSYNIVGNYYKSGKATSKSKKDRIVEIWTDKGDWFINNNFVYGFPDISKNNWNGGVQGDIEDTADVRVSKPFMSVSITTDEPEAALMRVINYAGCIIPSQDQVDKRIAYEVEQGTVFSGNGIINSQTEVGGWPSLKSVSPPKDSDKDGMPDEWEKRKNLDPGNPNDGNSLAASGYTFLEEYLNELGNVFVSLKNTDPMGNK